MPKPPTPEGLSKRIWRRLRARVGTATRLRRAQHPLADGHTSFDAPTDTRWAHQDGRFTSVLHVFHAEWPGIRAAAGYSPGRKLAIPSEVRLRQSDFEAVLRYLERERISTLVIHGCSANVFGLVEALRGARGSGLRVCAIWHGSTAQFANEFELDWFGELLALTKRGDINAFGAVKPGLGLLAPTLFPEPLLNLPPRLAANPASSFGARRVFIVAPNNWHKNFYTALFAAGTSAQVDEVLVTTDVSLPRSLSLRAAIRRVDSSSREELFQHMLGSSAVLHPSLSECQPMVAVESLALGVPCLTGPLALGGLEDHPYQQLVQLDDVGSLGKVRGRLERVLELEGRMPGTLREMMDAYRASLCSAALARLGEFLFT